MQTFRVEVGPIVSKGASPAIKRTVKRVIVAGAVVADLRKKGGLPDKAFIVEVVKGSRKLDRIRVTVRGDGLTITPIEETK